MTQDIKADAHQAHYPSNRPINPAAKRSAKKPLTHSWFDQAYNPVQGETALWIAVITQAVMDALSQSNNKQSKYHKHEAIRWLTENSKDFVEVCLSAGMDPDDVRRKAKRTMASPPLWRAAPGTGLRYQERKTYREKIKLMAHKGQELPFPGHLMEPPPQRAQILTGPWI